MFSQEAADDPCITHDTNDNKVGGIDDSRQPFSKCPLNWSGVLSRMSLKWGYGEIYIKAITLQVIPFHINIAYHRICNTHMKIWDKIQFQI